MCKLGDFPPYDPLPADERSDSLAARGYVLREQQGFSDPWTAGQYRATRTRDAWTDAERASEARAGGRHLTLGDAHRRWCSIGWTTCDEWDQRDYGTDR
jgi:hypothetical protein